MRFLSGRGRGLLIAGVLAAFVLWLVWHAHLIVHGSTILVGLLIVGLVLWISRS